MQNSLFAIGHSPFLPVPHRRVAFRCLATSFDFVRAMKRARSEEARNQGKEIRAVFEK